MLIRVHDESFVLFFYNSFILLDKKPLLLVVAFLTGGLPITLLKIVHNTYFSPPGVLMMIMYMSNKIIKQTPAGALM